ncbi:MAG: HK97 family phage prohead protease [Bacilli bacterium]|nr:HK97 family phage prohead protease [Bacilli bacterium]
MNVEIREDSVRITGYVNAVERLSKPITENIHGKVRTFLERIKAGTFRKAIKRNNNILVLLNHDKNRVLATTKNDTAKLVEDNIGLRADVTIYDKDVIEKARNNQLVGWSFGFYPNSDDLGSEGKNEIRTITDLDLLEVSILDDTKSPAYNGTSIYARSEDANLIYRTRMLEDEESEEREEESESEIVTDEKLDSLANRIAEKIVEKMAGAEEEKTIPEDESAEEEKETDDNSTEEGKRDIDYSSFEERISKLKRT